MSTPLSESPQEPQGEPTPERTESAETASSPTSAPESKRRRRRRRRPRSAPREAEAGGPEAAAADQAGEPEAAPAADGAGGTEAAPPAARKRKRAGRRRGKPKPDAAPAQRAPAKELVTVEDFVFAGEAASKRGDLSEATAYYRRALELDPDSARSYCGLGYLYLQVHQAREALAYFDSALERSPDDSWALYGAALARLELGDNEAAHSLAQSLMQHANTSFHANGHYIAGYAFYEQGLFEDAARELVQCAWELPTRRLRRRAQLLLADTYFVLRQPSEALRWLESARADHWTRSVEEQIGRLHLELEHFPDAEASFRAILDKQPRDTRATTALGQVYLRQQDYPRAIQMFEKALKQAPNNFHALDGIVAAYAKRGELSKAAGYLDRLDQAHQLPEAQMERRFRALSRERERREAELLQLHQRAHS